MVDDCRVRLVDGCLVRRGHNFLRDGCLVRGGSSARRVPGELILKDDCLPNLLHVVATMWILLSLPACAQRSGSAPQRLDRWSNRPGREKSSLSGGMQRGLWCKKGEGCRGAGARGA